MFDPDKSPRATAKLALAALLFVFSKVPLTTEGCFDAAEVFMKRAEQEVGKIDP